MGTAPELTETSAALLCRYKVDKLGQKQMARAEAAPRSRRSSG